MSTTTERAVAMGYAAGSGQKMGIVLEMQQGMVDRGADVSWLSVYPAEAEVLYPPLTYLRYVKTTPIKNSQGVVVDVRPSF